MDSETQINDDNATVWASPAGYFDMNDHNNLLSVQMPRYYHTIILEK